MIMGRPGGTEAVLVTLSRNITIAGKLWLVVLVLLRALPLLLAGFPLYWDEAERFACSTVQPGCANACYDAFRPLSPLRFWPLQLLGLCLPLALFCTHVSHRALSCPEPRPLSHPEPRPQPRDPDAALCSGHVSHQALPRPGQSEGRGEGRDFPCAYLVQVLIRLALEAGFGAGQYLLFGLRVPRRLLCGEAPCTSAVECFPSRPTEQTSALRLSLGLAAASLLLSTADLACALRRCARKRRDRAPGRKSGVEEEEEDEERYLSPSSLRADPPPPQTQDPAQRRASQSRTSKAGSAPLETGGVAVGSAAGSEAETGSNTNTNNAHPHPETGGVGRDGGGVGRDGGGVGRDVGGVGSGLTSPGGTPRPARSSDLRPPPSPRPGRRPGGGVGTPTTARAHRTGQRPLVDTLDSRSESGDSERRAWV
ncbi:gap junction delta-4 protein-like [Anguilla rostrata]|uniref:gap junction delta-4 protein-like n=1 Tax=Anguilla rostrata TaxID=7938 RepID=UPI0030D11D51